MWGQENKHQQQNYTFKILRLQLEEVFQQLIYALQKPNKIALGAVSISVVNEITPDYNIGLYASSMGGTNNFAGYFNQGDVYINKNLGIGILAPSHPLHVYGSDDRDNIYSEYSGSHNRAAIEGRASGSTGYGITGTAVTTGAKAGFFQNTAAGGLAIT